MSLVFPAFNRLEYTRESWSALMAHTAWQEVSQFLVYDDGSTDGTREWLEVHLCDCPVRPELIRSQSLGPVGVTIDWIQRSTAPMLAKIDNDAIYPPDWLSIALGVMDRNPRLDMLGLEAFHPTAPGLAPASYNYEQSYFVSGLGLYRRRVFEGPKNQLHVIVGKDGPYYGLEEHQYNRPNILRGWIKPSLPVFLLDRMLIEPWAGLSEYYVAQKWERDLSLRLRYPIDKRYLWQWWQPRYQAEALRALESLGVK